MDGWGEVWRFCLLVGGCKESFVVHVLFGMTGQATFAIAMSMDRVCVPRRRMWPSTQLLR